MQCGTRNATLAVACSLFLGLGIGGCASTKQKEPQEKTVSLDQAPAAVRQSVTKAVGTNKLDRLTSESEDGKTIYEAEFHANGAKHTVSIRETGEVIEEETEIALPDVPAAVSKAVTDKHAGAVVSKAELVKADGQTTYELAVRVGKEEREVKVSADGKVLSDEEEEENDKNDKD